MGPTPKGLAARRPAPSPTTWYMRKPFGVMRPEHGLAAQVWHKQDSCQRALQGYAQDAWLVGLCLGALWHESCLCNSCAKALCLGSGATMVSLQGSRGYLVTATGGSCCARHPKRFCLLFLVPSLLQSCPILPETLLTPTPQRAQKGARGGRPRPPPKGAERPWQRST